MELANCGNALATKNKISHKHNWHIKVRNFIVSNGNYPLVFLSLLRKCNRHLTKMTFITTATGDLLLPL